ncbi:hypothetical protein F5878DRAFT_163831 [Lentinula raphanica]|uniref:Uncharacterized protein n=1 Tax=Lentinula raphanica TaxID=153919 RepID=A0AA38PKK6_9AGAR|nr:hypothetical protein F5878DRAFT_163831 [Lentinula raphanica]
MGRSPLTVISSRFKILATVPVQFRTSRYSCSIRVSQNFTLKVHGAMDWNWMGEFLYVSRIFFTLVPTVTKASLCLLPYVGFPVFLFVSDCLSSTTRVYGLCASRISRPIFGIGTLRYRRAPKRRGQEERKINHKLLLLSYLWLTWFDNPAGNRSSYMLCLVLIHKNLILHSTPHDDLFTTTSLSPLALRLTPLLSKVSLMKIGLHGLLYAVKIRWSKRQQLVRRRMNVKTINKHSILLFPAQLKSRRCHLQSAKLISF